MTVTGLGPERRIVETPLGLPVQEVLGLSPAEFDLFQGLLLGGYGGGWLPMAEAMAMPLTEEAARKHGSSIGPGVVALVRSEACPLAELSRVVTYMEGQGANQCGPCINGLAGLASAMEALAFHPSTLRGGTSSILYIATSSRAEGHADIPMVWRGSCAPVSGSSPNMPSTIYVEVLVETRWDRFSRSQRRDPWRIVRGSSDEPVEYRAHHRSHCL